MIWPRSEQPAVGLGGDPVLLNPITSSHSSEQALPFTELSGTGMNLNGSQFHLQQTPGYKLGVSEQIFYLAIFKGLCHLKLHLAEIRLLEIRK